MVAVDQSLWGYFVHAGFVVKCVMLLLVAASVFSWTFIIDRGLFLRQMRQSLSDFEDRFWSGIDLTTLYRGLDQHAQRLSGLERVFHAGFAEFSRLKTQALPSAHSLMDSVSRSMTIAIAREREALEMHLPFLATVGSTSPYVGLFGTVWGIMAAFQALGQVQQATIAMVAPGISEALIATAMGLFAAIPAVIAYNRYAAMVQQMNDRYDTFQEELTNVFYRWANTADTVEPRA